MIDTGSIQKAIDTMSDFINQNGNFPEPVVDELNGMLYLIECNAEFEMIKQKTIEKGLSDFIFRIMCENPDLKQQLKQKMYETLLG